MSQILENFDDPDSCMDFNEVGLFDATEVDISTVVEFGEIIGRGNYGLVRKGLLLSTNETVAIKIIQKSELKAADIDRIKVHVD